MADKQFQQAGRRQEREGVLLPELFNQTINMKQRRSTARKQKRVPIYAINESEEVKLDMDRLLSILKCYQQIHLGDCQQYERAPQMVLYQERTDAIVKKFKQYQEQMKSNVEIKIDWQHCCSVSEVGGHGGDYSGGLVEWEEGVVWRGYSGIVEKLEASGHNWIKLVEEDDIRQPTLGVLNGSIVAVGGLDKDTWSKKVRVLNVRERCWDSSLIPDMIVACSGACVVSSEGHLIVIGGFDGQKKLDLVQVYVVQIKRWFLGKSLPEACFSGSAVVQSGTSDIVYVIGGDGMANRVWSAKVKDLITEQPAGSIWNKEPDVPYFRSSICVRDDVIFAIGGQEKEEHRSKRIPSIHAFSPTHQKWVHVEDIPMDDCSLLDSLVLTGGNLVVVDGNSKEVWRCKIGVLYRYSQQCELAKELRKDIRQTYEDILESIKNEARRKENEDEAIARRNLFEQEILQLGQLVIELRTLLAMEDREHLDELVKRRKEQVLKSKAMCEEKISKLQSSSVGSTTNKDVEDLKMIVTELNKRVQRLEDEKNDIMALSNALNQVETNSRDDYISCINSHEQDTRSKYQEGLNSKPHIPDLMNWVAAEVPDKWDVVGVQLGLSPNEVNFIRQYAFGNFQFCFMQVFMSWKDRSKIAYTWNTLIDVLTTRSVGCNDLASKLRNALEFQTVNVGATFTTSSATPDPHNSQQSHSTCACPPPVATRRSSAPPTKPHVNLPRKVSSTYQPSANTATSADLSPTHHPEVAHLSSLSRSSILERENRHLHSILKGVVDEYNHLLGNRNP